MIDVIDRLARETLSFQIEHNTHKVYYESAEDYLRDQLKCPNDATSADDVREMIRTGEVWEVSFCPTTPVGSMHFARATREEALRAAEEWLEARKGARS